MDVGKALRNTSKGQLKYDKYWVEEGRTKEILDKVSEFSTKVAINVSPKALTHIISSLNKETVKDEEDKCVSTLTSTPGKSKEKGKDFDTFFYELQTETELPIIEYEEERLKYIEDIFKAKKEEFESFSKNLEQHTEQQYHLLQRNNELDVRRRAADLKKIENAIIEEAKEKVQLQKQRFQTQAKKLSAIVQEAEIKQKKAEEELKRREQEQQEFMQQLTNSKLEAENLVTKAKQKLMTCEHSSFLKTPVKERFNQMTQFLDDIKVFIECSKSQLLTFEDIFNANEVVKKIYIFLQDVMNDIEFAKVAALQNHEKRLQESREVSVLPEASVVAEAPESETAVKSSTSGMQENGQGQNTEKTTTAKSRISSEASAVLSTFIAPDAVQEFHKIKENLKNVKDSIQAFIDDPRNKKYRFELQKSINFPINAISSISGTHVRDKISRLLSILNTKAPNKDMTSEAVIYNFCANLVARKFVEQGDKQISAQHITAFPIALAVVGVWIKKPDVGSLILGHFYSNCPYLVPYYPPRKENQSDQEYYESLGYYFDKEGNMEATYKFLNRMSGFMRLYAAIITSPVPPSTTKYPHPHGIACGWKWLSRILNINPRPDITATLLYDFLEVAGNMLQKTYGKQFKKLLHIICKDFFPKIKRVTPSGSGGPVERLETFLQQTIKKGCIPPPEGILDSGFWNR